MAKVNSIASTKADDDWRVENDLRTLMEAECIEMHPKRLAAAQKLAKSKLLDLAAVAAKGPKD